MDRELDLLGPHRHRDDVDLRAAEAVPQRAALFRDDLRRRVRLGEMEALPRICLIGPECTGKTTAAQALAAHYGTVWVPEAAREHAIAVARPLTVDDHVLIAHRHLVNESRLAPDARNVLILDCDLVST